MYALSQNVNLIIYLFSVRNKDAIEEILISVLLFVLNTHLNSTMRPHPALIPHFQLPNDINHTNCLHIIPPSTSQANQTLSPENSSIPKRFMYKTAKSGDDYGKHWGADDDLTLLNVIENIFKSKLSQQNASTKIVHVQKRSELKKAKHLAQPDVTSNYIDNIRFLLNELSETQRQNNELKQMSVFLQEQLEMERKWTQRLESYIRKHCVSSSTLAVVNGNNNLRKDIPNVSLIDEGSEK